MSLYNCLNFEICSSKARVRQFFKNISDCILLLLMYEQDFVTFVEKIDLFFDQLKFLNVNKHKMKIEKKKN